MSSIPLAACLPQRLIVYGKSGFSSPDAELKEYENMVDTVVTIEDDSIVLDPKQMNIRQYYLAVVNDTPYIYRRVNDQEIEIYGLARKD